MVVLCFVIIFLIVIIMLVVVERVEATLGVVSSTPVDFLGAAEKKREQREKMGATGEQKRGVTLLLLLCIIMARTRMEEAW